MTDELDEMGWTQIARYLAGELNPGERARFEELLATDPERSALVEQARLVWRESRRSKSSFDPERALVEIKRASRSGSSQPVVDQPIRPAPNLAAPPARRRWIAVAALAAAAAAIGFVVSNPRPPQSPPAAWTELVTRRGQRAELRLPEGTRVVLGVDSRLRYPERFGPAPGARQVKLDGQAYFEVVHDVGRPFEVVAGDARVRDLGTTFTVTNRPASPIEVVVSDGAVTLAPAAGAGDSVIIRRAELGRLTTGGKLQHETGADLQRHLGWTEGRLVFVDTPLAEVAPALGRWYDVDVRVTDSSIAGLRLTASFSGEPIGEVLDLITSSLKVTYEPRGSTIRIFRGR